MGNLFCCIKLNRDKKRDYEEHLIRYIYCDQCKREYISYYEYNKHIYECNQRYNNKQT